MTSTTTQQQQLQRHNNRMIENRRFDYAYDKSYHVSNHNDYAQEGMKAQTGSSTIVIIIFNCILLEIKTLFYLNFISKCYQFIKQCLVN
jgi:hypothetical protein